MTTWTYAQLMGIWVNNGGNKAMAPLMAAIAEVESSGNDQAENPSGATGLWQLEWPLYANFVPGATSRAAYQDPNINARAAVKLSQNNPSTAPGSPVYDNWLQYEPPNAYKGFMNGSTTPDTSVPGGSSSGGGANATLTASAGSDCAFSLGGQHLGVFFGHGPSLPSVCVISKSEIRAFLGAGLIVAGAVPMMLGALILAAFAFRASGAQQAVTQTAAAIPTPAGRVAKAGTAAGTRAHKRRQPTQPPATQTKPGP